MRKLKLFAQIIVACVLAMFAYSWFYEPHAESMRSTARQSLPAVAQQLESLGSGAGSQSGELRIRVLDVGQGDAILLQDGKRNVMIDVGDNRRHQETGTGGQQALLAQLAQAGVQRIDTVILTHPHNDHIGNILKVRGQFSVRRIYDNGWVNERNQLSQRLYAELRAGKYHGKALKAGDVVKLGKDYYLEVLAPGDFLQPSLLRDNLNNTSLVLMLHYGSFKMLLTGDAEKEVEAVFAQRYGDKLQADVLKVGHHGSMTSSIWRFASEVKPKYALISCGPYAIHHHPNKDTVGRLQYLGAKVLTTHEHGMLTVTTDGKDFQVTTER